MSAASRRFLHTFTKDYDSRFGLTRLSRQEQRIPHAHKLKAAQSISFPLEAVDDSCQTLVTFHLFPIWG